MQEEKNMSETKQTISSEIEFSTFMVGDALFGIDILNIQEINKHIDITRVPQAESYIEGILNLRGRIVTIIDLGSKLGLGPVQKSGENRNIIVNSDGEHIGLLVDKIGDVLTMKKSDIDVPPSNVAGAKGRFFQGVLKTDEKLIGILDLNKILAP